MLDFTAKLNNNKVNLNWKTLTEINNDYFIIEKSIDNINYSFVERVKGAGRSNRLINYNTIDENPYNGVSYYRLKQIDFDGNYECFSPVAVNNSNNENDISINLYPNPITLGNDLIVYSEIINENTLFSVIDIKGTVIFNNYTISSNTITINTNNIEKGIYFIVIESNNKVFHERFIVK